MEEGQGKPSTGHEIHIEQKQNCAALISTLFIAELNVCILILPR